MKLNIVSETSFGIKANGVHTAFVDHLYLLGNVNGVDVYENSAEKCDIMHSHTYGPYYFLKGHRYIGRRVFTVHVIPASLKGTFPFAKHILPLVKWYLRQVYNYADVCVSISPMVSQALRDLNIKSKIVEINNPINLDKWKFDKSKREIGRKLLNIDPHEKIVMCVGQVQGRKGIEDFIDIAALCPDKKFVWVGGRPFGIVSEGLTRINNKIKNAGPNIIFAGMHNLDTMPSLYAAADIFIFTSYQENCPLAPLEAAASGLPVVFRDLEEYRLLYEHAFISASDNIGFANWINLLCSNEIEYASAKMLSKNILIQFDKSMIKEKFIRMYKELIEQKKLKHEA